VRCITQFSTSDQEKGDVKKKGTGTISIGTDIGNGSPDNAREAADLPARHSSTGGRSSTKTQKNAEKAA
jgi:hypothetical protein